MIRYFGTQIDKAALKAELWCLKSAEPGQLGWKPFSIFAARIVKATAGSDDPKDVVFDVIEHSPALYVAGRSTLDYCQLRIEFDGGEDTSHVILDVPAWREACRNPDLKEWTHRKGYRVSWNKQLRGQLVQAEKKMVWSRFKCPECTNGVVTYGTQELETR